MLLQIYYMEKYIFPYYPKISPLDFVVSPKKYFADSTLLRIFDKNLSYGNFQSRGRNTPAR